MGAFARKASAFRVRTTTEGDSTYLFADRVYLSPRGHRLLGEYAFGRIRERW